jgi:hypothetical protein
MKNRARLHLKFLFFIAGVILCFQFAGCREKFDKSLYGNCSDGIQNQKEQQVDCGGQCMPCMSCDDGMKNGTETGIDCGGACQSCTAPCTLPAETITYTLGSQSSFAYTNSQPLYGKGFYSGSSIAIDFSGGGSTGLTRMTLTFSSDFNPIAALALGQTMVFKTVTDGFSISKRSSVKIDYRGNFGFSGFGGVINSGQAVYMTKKNSSDVDLKFCSLAAGRDTLSLMATAR